MYEHKKVLHSMAERAFDVGLLKTVLSAARNAAQNAKLNKSGREAPLHVYSA